MQNIYGYKEKDIVKLITYIKENSDKSLSENFREFAKHSKKKAGTIRNMYYAISKESQVNKDFRDKYLNGKEITVAKKQVFSKMEENKLLDKIANAQNNGKSVRSAVIELSNGDERLALRLQNKYRNIKKKDLKSSYYNDFQIKRVKGEIDNMFNRIIGEIKIENESLKSKINSLEKENLKLCAMLFSNEENKVKNYFNISKKNNNIG